MAGSWIKQRVLIAVRTYPVPAGKGVEVSCTAGVTDSGNWIRLFPVPYRLLDYDKRFKKYQWIEVETIKATGDPRPESFKLNAETIKISTTVSSDDGWRARKELFAPLIRQSMCHIKREHEANGSPTLGLFKPAEITRLIFEKTDSEWTQQQLNTLAQEDLFLKSPNQKLEKIPFNFKYEFRCDDSECKGHSMTCFDWEIGEAYRRWKNDYGVNWESKFRQRFEDDMINKNDTHLFVGNMHKHPSSWIIVGLFYPPKVPVGDLI
jgi:hypothetical protein